MCSGSCGCGAVGSSGLEGTLSALWFESPAAGGSPEGAWNNVPQEFFSCQHVVIKLLNLTHPGLCQVIRAHPHVCIHSHLTFYLMSPCVHM